MHRRTILNLIPAALLTALIPWKVKARKVTKGYLGYNEPYDRSLVRIKHESSGMEGWLSYELTPGKIYTLMMNQTEWDLDKLHHALGTAVKFRWEYGPMKHFPLSSFSGTTVMLCC